MEKNCSLDQLTDDQLIELYKEFNCESKKLDKYFSTSYLGYTRRLLIKRGIDYNGVREEYLKSLKENYIIENPTKCLYCGKPLPWERRNEKYCCSSCSAKDNNRKRPRVRKIKIDSSVKELVIIRTEKCVSFLNSLSREEAEHFVQIANWYNKNVDTIYLKYKLPYIEPGQCPICGNFGCKDDFCKKYPIRFLIFLSDYFGFNLKTLGSLSVKTELDRIKENLYNLYWIKGLSAQVIGVDKGLDKQRITRLFKKLGIPLRSNKSLENTSSLVFEKSISSFSINSRFSKKVSHKSWDGTFVFFRSSYELYYAMKLDISKISYKVENLRINYYNSSLNMNKIAIPDFYLPDTNEVVEVKSDFTLDIQEMLDKFDAYKKLGYTPKLILEHEEIDLYNIENLISPERLEKIRTQNIKQVCQK